MAEPRFCMYQYQHLPLTDLEHRWRRAEELGFDVLWNVDTVVEPDRPRHPIFDGPATLALMADRTATIRVGTLVSSLYFRSPVTLAKATVTIDHLSGGRLELALGVGDPAAGEGASGVSWRAGERVERFCEFLELVDLLLRRELTTYEGRFFRCRDAERFPAPVQEPRPPITVAAHGPRMLTIAARFADGWSSWGGYDIETEAEFFAITRDRSARFDDLCVAADRDPRAVLHSLVCFPPLTPWESVAYFEDFVGRYREIGIDEFVLYWPGHWRVAPHEVAVMDEACGAIMPRLRSTGASPAPPA